MLGEVGPVVDSTRTAAVAAALVEFDSLRGAAARAPAPRLTPVASLPARRMRMYRVVTGLAAAAVVGVVAVGVLNLSGSDAKTSSVALDSGATAGTAVAAEAPQPNNKIAADTAGAADATAIESAAAAPAFALPAIDTDEALSQYVRDVGTAAAQSTAAPAATRAPAEAAPGGYAQLPCLTSDQVVIGSIMFKGESAVAVRDTATGHILALDALGCRVLTEITP
ncbi:MAG: hypothetical protein ABIZ69_09310, partial [Ilumatobacteraceae bacterium]